MADIKKLFYIENSDGTEFSSANNPGAMARLRNSNDAGEDLGEYTGNSAGSGNMAEIGSGVWSIMINSGDNGQFRVETSTGAGWTAVDGYAPFSPKVSETLLLTGGTMRGDIDMDSHNITNAKNLDVETGGKIGGIEKQNLIDKTKDEAITGGWSFAGNNTSTGEFNFGTDKLMTDNIIVSPFLFICWNHITAGMNKADVNGTLFIADNDYEIVQVQAVWEVNEATASQCWLQLEKLSDGEAEGAGDIILTDNTDNGINLRANAKNIQTGTLHATNKILANGNRIGLLISDDTTELEGLHITIKLKRI